MAKINKLLNRLFSGILLISIPAESKVQPSRADDCIDTDGSNGTPARAMSCDEEAELKLKQRMAAIEAVVEAEKVAGTLTPAAVAAAIAAAIAANEAISDDSNPAPPPEPTPAPTPAPIIGR